MAHSPPGSHKPLTPQQQPTIPTQPVTGGRMVGNRWVPPSSFSQGKVQGGGEKEATVGRMLIGDIVAHALAKVNITDEKVSKWMGKECGCKERREKLNQLEKWAMRVFGFKNVPLSEKELAEKEAQAKADLERMVAEGEEADRIEKEKPK